MNIFEHVLTVTATKQEEREEDTDTYHRRERFVGKAQRTLNLPRNANCDRAEAKFENGVLTLTFPKFGGVEGGTKLLIA